MRVVEMNGCDNVEYAVTLYLPVTVMTRAENAKAAERIVCNREWRKELPKDIVVGIPTHIEAREVSGYRA